MYKASVFETSDSAFLLLSDDVYIKDSNGVYKADLSEVMYGGFGDLYVKDGDVWLHDLVKNSSVLAGSNNNPLPYIIGDEKMAGLCYFSKKHSERGISKFSNSGKELSFFPVDSSFYFSVNEDHIFIRSRKKMVCLDLEFNEIWDIVLNKRPFTDLDRSPQLLASSELLILNSGEVVTGNRGDFEINAYHSDNGSLVWQHIIDKSPSFSKLINDKVYVWDNEHILILDAATGEVLVRERHGYTHPEHRSFSRGSVYPLENGKETDLLLICEDDGGVQINTFDCKTIKQAIYAPDPYTISGNTPPVFHNKKVYIKLTHQDWDNNTMKGAFMVLSQTDSEENEIVPCLDGITGNPLITDTEICSYGVIKPRPPVNVSLMEDANGELIYSVTIEHSDYDDIIRFGIITLKEVAFKHGSYTSATETNKRHSGKLVLNIKTDLSSGPENYLIDKFKIIKNSVEKNLADSNVLAGDGVNNFSVDVNVIIE